MLPAFLPLLILAAGAATGTMAAKAETRLEKYQPGAAPPPFDSSLLDPLDAYVQVRSAGFAAWSDSGMWIGTTLGRYPQIHHVASPGADRRQATFFPRRSSDFKVNPVAANHSMVYLFDSEGDEQYRARLFDFASGDTRPLGIPPGRVDGLMWNDSGTAFIYAHVPQGSDRWDIRMGGPLGLDTLLLSLPGTWTPMDLRPDGKRLLVQRYVSAAEAELYALDIPGGALTLLTPSGPPAYVDDAAWIRTPSWLDPAAADTSWSAVFTSDRGGEAHRLYLLRPDSLSAEPIAPPALEADRKPPPVIRQASRQPLPLSPAVPWDVEWISVAPDRRTLAYSVNEDGYSRPYVLESGHKEPRAVANPPGGLIQEARFRPGPKPREFAVTVAHSASPGDVYVCDWAAGKWTRWTFSESGGLPASAFRRPQAIRYPSPGMGPMPAWLYRPDSAAFPGPRPVIIQIHGGPEQQARPGFDPFLQFLAGRMGYAVIQPNVRGSSGYGKSWLKADDGYQRMGSVRDIGALLDWIRTDPGLDAGRVAVTGRSYGGFMSLSSLVEYGPRLKAGISAVGISHFPSFLKKTSGYRRDLRRAEYGDERDPRMASFLDSISPLTRADRIRTPLLLCHGRNDPRVPYGESERIFAALKARKVPAWFLTFADEGHGVKDQDNQVAQWRVQAAFLGQHLGQPPEQKSGTPARSAAPPPAPPRPR